MHKWVTGFVQKGHGIASGNNHASPYPSGSIEMQSPYFLDLGLDLNRYYKATINISLNSNFLPINPDIEFLNVYWTSLHPSEDFSFWRIRLYFHKLDIFCDDAIIYYPSPKTKKLHFQNDNIIEVITKKVEGLSYGQSVNVFLPQFCLL